MVFMADKNRTYSSTLRADQARQTRRRIVDAAAELRGRQTGREWSRQAIARMAPTMRCPQCFVVGGLRLDWAGDRGKFACHGCGYVGG